MVIGGSSTAGLHISAARSVKYIEGRESPLAERHTNGMMLCEERMSWDVCP